MNMIMKRSALLAVVLCVFSVSVAFSAEVLLVNDKDGKECVKIELSPTQIALLKTKAKATTKPSDTVRVILHPSQLAELKKLLGPAAARQTIIHVTAQDVKQGYSTIPKEHFLKQGK